MSKAIQRMVNNNGVYATTQFQLTTEDITLDTGIVADVFFSCKSSDDTNYILCGKNISYVYKAKLIKITNNGGKTISVLNWNYSANFREQSGVYRNQKIMLSRDEQSVIVVCYTSQLVVSALKINISDIIEGNINIGNTENIKEGSYYYSTYFMINQYRDLYFWILTNYTSSIGLYSQSSPYNLLATLSLNYMVNIAVDINNQCWILVGNNNQDYIYKVVYDGVNLSSTNTMVSTDRIFESGVRQSLIDKWGDLIVLTSTSKLIKINLTGTPTIIDNIDLGGVRYNLNTNKDGTYFYSNGLNTWKIPANTAQGQVFDLTKMVIRGTGLATYNNDITGYNVSSLSSAGC